MSMAANRNLQRQKRHRRVRRRVSGTAERPRLCVYKSARHIYAQLVDDTCGHTLAAASTVEPQLRADVSSPDTDAARLVGSLIAERALARGIRRAVFDRAGYPYHGKVKALAEAAREGGLVF
ncbi:MAG: 50S ribosomal protein L18 [Candidatus Bipolaricaulaceae bacterium]